MTDEALAPGAIRLRNVSRKFKVVHERSATLKETLIRRNRSRHTELWALRDVSLDIRPGESVALVGRNGSGKSTLLKMLAGIIPPHSGTIATGGSVASMLELGSGFHPDFTGRENVFMNGAIHGLSERTVRERLEEIVEFAELQEFIDMPVRTYSSGMQMRLAFAVAAHVNPDILLLDEVLAVGDAAFQQKCISRIAGFLDRGGTLIFVSHAAASVKEICSRAILMDSGIVRADGPTLEVVQEYEDALARGEGHTGGEFADAIDQASPAMKRVVPAEVDITSVELTSGGALLVDGHLTSGARLDVTVHFRVIKDLPPLDVALYMTNSHLQEVLAICSSEGGLMLPRGRGDFACRVSLPLPLQEDSLAVRAVVRSHLDGQVFAEHTAQTPVRVQRVRPGHGLLSPDAAWTLEGAPRALASSSTTPHDQD